MSKDTPRVLDFIDREHSDVGSLWLTLPAPLVRAGSVQAAMVDPPIPLWRACSTRWLVDQNKFAMLKDIERRTA